MIKIKELREQQGLSQGKLAELSGINIMTISKLEKETTDNTSIRTLKRIASVLKCDWKDLC